MTMYKLTNYFGPVIKETVVAEVMDKSVRLIGGNTERLETTSYWWFRNREDAKAKAIEICQRQLEQAAIRVRSAQHNLKTAENL